MKAPIRLELHGNFVANHVWSDPCIVARMDTTRVVAGLLGGALFLACSVETTPPLESDGVSIMATGSLSGCKGKASSQVPSDGVYVITTFGGATESQQMSCGSHTQNGSWYYAASRQRYGCGSKIKIEANGKCVVAQTDDYGPDVCVENAAGRAIIDVSPMVAQELFGVSGMGWSDNKTVTVSQTEGSAQLGPCSGTSTEGDPNAGSGGSAGEGGNCQCDSACQQYGDCCANCGGGSGGSGGSGSAGSGSGGSSGGECSCESDCTSYGDCCEGCGTGGGSASGGSSGGQCYCDEKCAEYGDCCANCGGGGSGSGSGSGGSGPGCYCDAECAQNGDCCSDCS
jgi:hypothetical protein